MHRLTIVFGVLLIAVAFGAYTVAGTHDAHMLHPAGIGFLLIIFGALAHTPDVKRRALYMHLAVVVGLIGFLFGAKGAIEVYKLAHGTVYANPIGVEERATICLICMLFVAFCVRSFIEARRARVLGS